MIDLSKIASSAAISDCGHYRYELRRCWDVRLPVLVTCMFNPSTADATKNDPTILRLIGFAESWGYGGVMVVNLFSRRSSSPERLKFVLANDEFGLDGPYHRDYWSRAIQVAKEGRAPILAAWGAHGKYLRRAEAFTSTVRPSGAKMICLKLTGEGFPMHPLARGRHRIPDSAMPESFP